MHQNWLAWLPRKWSTHCLSLPECSLLKIYLTIYQGQCNITSLYRLQGVSLHKNIITSNLVIQSVSTLKKSKKDTGLTVGPYFSSFFGKKNMKVKAASTMSGRFRLSSANASRSWRLSRPRQNAISDFSAHFGPVFACTENMSSDTLKQCDPPK